MNHLDFPGEINVPSGAVTAFCTRLLTNTFDPVSNKLTLSRKLEPALALNITSEEALSFKRLLS